MRENKLRCVVQEDSNIIRIVPIPAPAPPLVETNKKKNSSGQTTGRWTKKEQLAFIETLVKHGKKWAEIQRNVSTRSVVQIRTHAQKFFLRLQRVTPPGMDPLEYLKTKPAKSFLSFVKEWEDVDLEEDEQHSSGKKLKNKAKDKPAKDSVRNKKDSARKDNKDNFVEDSDEDFVIEEKVLGNIWDVSSDGIGKNGANRKPKFIGEVPAEPTTRYKQEHLVGKRSSMKKQQKKPVVNEVSEELQPPHVWGESEEFQQEPEPNPYNQVPPPLNPYPAVYAPPTVTGRAQEQLCQLDANMRSLAQNMEYDMQTKFSTPNPGVNQWNYIYGVTMHLHRIIQNLSAFNSSGTTMMEPQMIQYQPQLMYTSGESYMPYHQMAYMMPQSDMNNHTPI